jgi:DNA-binding CsgD family transcriptional regulator
LKNNPNIFYSEPENLSDYKYTQYEQRTPASTTDGIFEYLLAELSKVKIKGVYFRHSTILNISSHSSESELFYPTSQSNILGEAVSTYLHDGGFVGQQHTDFGIELDHVAVKVYGPNGREGFFFFLLDSTLGADFEEAVHASFTRSAQAAYLLLFPHIEPQRASRSILSPRESEIVKYVATGVSNILIAEEMGISAHTVNGYIRSIYLKTDTNDKISLSFYALHHGLLE